MEPQEENIALDSRPNSIAKLPTFDPGVQPGKRVALSRVLLPYSDGLAKGSMSGVLANTAAEDWELRYDVEEVYLQANIDEDYRAFCNVVSLLRKAVYGLVQLAEDYVGSKFSTTASNIKD